MTATLPPLPKATLNDGQNLFFTEAVLRAFVAEAVAAEREQCALECERRHANGNRAHTHADECAAAIRARKDTP
jgi:hypothetical protein